MLIFWIGQTIEKPLKILKGLSLRNFKGKHSVRLRKEIGLEVRKHVIEQVVQRESEILQLIEWH